MKIRCENWSVCYPYFMMYFIETKTLISNLLARNKLLLSLPSSVNASIMNAWEDFSMEDE